jgi:hypothetical protein
VVAAFLLGLILHAVDRRLAFRAEPGPVLLTAPVAGTAFGVVSRSALERRLGG